MDIDDDDDFYAPSEDVPDSKQSHEQPTPSHKDIKPEPEDEDLEEGEEDEGEDDGSDSDIDIITERKDGTKAAPPSQARYNEIRNIPQRTASSDVTIKPAIKKEALSKGSTTVSGANLPAVATSKIDIDARPVYEPAGKAITLVNIDEDLTENDKPWRRPGTDISDYFNYGFDEFTWALYATKQETLRLDYNQDKIAQSNKKMLEDMNLMMNNIGGLANSTVAPQAMAPMVGLEGISPETQAMMQQMMGHGIDHTQMDPATIYQTMPTAQGGVAGQGTGQGGNQGQAFGGQQGFGQGTSQQQMGYNFDQSNMNGGMRGGFKGRGRGHRNW